MEQSFKSWMAKHQRVYEAQEHLEQARRRCASKRGASRGHVVARVAFVRLSRPMLCRRSPISRRTILSWSATTPTPPQRLCWPLALSPTFRSSNSARVISVFWSHHRGS
jgi:hypothetical protein